LPEETLRLSSAPEFKIFPILEKDTLSELRIIERLKQTKPSVIQITAGESRWSCLRTRL